MIAKSEVLDVLLIEDDEDDYLITRALLSKAESIECNLDWARSFDEGLESILSSRYDACLVDYRLGARTGLDLLQEVNNRGGVETPIILLTGQGDLEVDLNAMAAGAADYLSKERIDAPLLERSIRYAVERKEADQRIREQAQFLDKARDAIIAFDMDGRVVYWNKSAERLTGWTADEMLGARARERLYGPSETDKLEECHESVREDGEWMGELRQQTKEGEELVVESRWTLVRDSAGQPTSILVINTDITERKRLESQFLRSQRMESIGRLVGGIAHDLGNLLVPILLGVKVLKRRDSGDGKVRQTLEMIEKSAERGSNMVEQVLAFARGVEGERVALQAQTIIEEVAKIVTETFPDGIDVQVAVPDDLNDIVGDATQVQQVLMNLCVNARDAMPDGGTISIQASETEVTEAEAHRKMDAEPGAYICLTVADTGTGIPDEAIDKIFEPFFSTKAEGEGTGLGLSTAYSIVKSHKGFVDVESEDGEGTTFRVYLPVATSSDRTRGPADSGELRDGQGECILVVDDEEFILDTARQTLEDAGYRVMTAQGGQDAIRVMERSGDDVEAIITDLRMPEMNGFDLIRKLRPQYPNLPIIAASGMADGRTDDALEAGAQTFLAKPFTADKLQATLQDVLHENKDAASVGG
ncbi:hybrid sensor histidine kinase/response regulator [Longibacter salinarum]|uniref:histidine kinase n=1 Tax=Longibacter salinarum TaxID=1850348 RepID=A0A2A8CYR4_9BACT|nr:response regulator [Longibacter salinarum]PEN13743.1 hybrid sensor histidine kinase/response regulator [Longibacter salinarum]